MGCDVEYNPSSKGDIAQLKPFGKNTRRGIYLCPDQRIGGAPNKDVWVVNYGELNEADHLSDVHLRRIAHKAVIPIKVGEDFKFPLVTGECNKVLRYNVLSLIRSVSFIKYFLNS